MLASIIFYVPKFRPSEPWAGIMVEGDENELG